MSDLKIIKTNTKQNSRTSAANSVEIACVQYIRKRYNVKYNMFENEYIIKNKRGKKNEISEDDLYLYLRSDGIKISHKSLSAILKSQNKDWNVSTDFNPVSDYLLSLTGKFKADESEINKYASYIKPRKFHKTEKAKKRFQKYFKKWFVAMVATALGITKNDVMFVIIQEEGGTGKTRYIEHLVTSVEQLAYYYKTIVKNNYRTDITKDITKNLLINFDELAALNKRYLQTFKGDISQQNIKQKFAYMRKEIVLKRLGSFAGTTNFSAERGGFIQSNDKGLMRRMFCVENVGYIDYESYTKEVNMEQMYAEAVNLIKNTNFDYNFNQKDYADFQQYNYRYLKPLDVGKLIELKFKPGINGEAEYLQAKDIQKEFIQEGFTPEYISLKIIGLKMAELGFIFTQKRLNKDNKKNKRYYKIQRIKHEQTNI